MAEAIFNNLTNGKGIAISAGIDPGQYESRKIAEVGPNVVKSTKDLGINVSDKVSKRLTKEITDSADMIISMVKKGELPYYLRDSKKPVIWSIDDPKNMDYNGHFRIRNMIYEKVKKLTYGMLK